MLQTDMPLYLPEGSIRAVLALAIVAAFIFGLVTQLELVMLVLGFYFGSRASSG